MKIIFLLFFSTGIFATELPNLILTPGDTLTTDTACICRKGYSETVRDVSDYTKKKIYKAYGITKHKKGEYEIDHLIPLELGGSNDTKNLWPQKYEKKNEKALWGAHKKDRLENRLRRLICTKKITVKEAQDAIRENWIEAYKKYVEEPVNKAQKK